MPGRDSPNAAREIDGRYARLRKPRKPPTARYMIAQWVKAQVVRLQAMGMTFEQIAAELTAAGNGRGTTITLADGRSASAVKIDGLQFWPGYSISAMGCHKAWKVALASRVSLGVREMRVVDNARSEQLYMATQSGVLRGNPQAITAALRVLQHLAKVNGYFAPEKIEHNVHGSPEMPPGGVELEQVLDALSPEKQMQLAELLKEAKAASETPETAG